MTPEFAYFLKVNVAFILLYAFYRLFFYKDTFFKLRRTILLAFFGVSLLYPLMNIQDWIRTDAEGRGMINVLDSVKLVQNPTLYATFLLWLLWTPLPGMLFPP